jgi:hypothetical protein
LPSRPVTLLAVVAKDDVSAYDAEVTVPPTLPAATYDAVVANDELTDTLAVPKVEPLCIPINEPVNEPVLTAKVMDVAAEAVVENEDVNAYDAEVTVPPTAPAATYDAVVANDELTDTLAVPNVEPLCVPINDPVNDPVLTANVMDVAADDVNA